MSLSHLLPTTADPLHDDVLGTHIHRRFVRTAASSRFVLVGDHAPELRINHDPCDADRGATTVDQCKGAACKAHNRCCWQ